VTVAALPPIDRLDAVPVSPVPPPIKEVAEIEVTPAKLDTVSPSLKTVDPI
jgi:hypothetical protein